MGPAHSHSHLPYVATTTAPPAAENPFSAAHYPGMLLPPAQPQHPHAAAPGLTPFPHPPQQWPPQWPPPQMHGLHGALAHAIPTMAGPPHPLPIYTPIALPQQPHASYMPQLGGYMHLPQHTQVHMQQQPYGGAYPHPYPYAGSSTFPCALTPQPNIRPRRQVETPEEEVATARAFAASSAGISYTGDNDTIRGKHEEAGGARFDFNRMKRKRAEREG